MNSNLQVLCIPRVCINISESRIRKIFDGLDMGILERIDIINKQNNKGEKFNCVFLHFKEWNDSENAYIARRRLLNGEKIKIIYDDPFLSDDTSHILDVECGRVGLWRISAYRESERKKTAHPKRNSLEDIVVNNDY